MLKTFKHFYFSDTIVLFNFSQSSWALSTTAPVCRSSLYEAVILSQGQFVLSGTLGDVQRHFWSSQLVLLVCVWW